MASSSTEASEIRRKGRRRLIGAIVIALLLIVFVPMLLDSEPRPQREEPALRIPPKENAPPLPAPTVEPKGAMKAATPNPAREPSAPPATESTAEPAKLAPEAPKVAEAERKTVEEPKIVPATAPPKVAAVEPKAAPSPKVAAVEPKAPPAAASKQDGFAVQVGAFKDEVKLKQAREKLAAAKIASYTEPSGDFTRLRVGPFPTRDAAENAAKSIRRSVPDAKVVPLP